MNLVEQIALAIGAETPGIRLLLSLFAGYPLAFIHRRFFHGTPPTTQHVYFFLCGLFLSWFNFGGDCLHSLLCVFLMFAMLRVIGGTLASVIIAFVFNLTYLMVGYTFISSETYNIDWTTPHCVLTLRLIGLVFDVYDGQQDEATWSRDQKQSALRQKPSLMEVLSYSFFFGGYLIGPQFNMRRYQNFVNGVFADTDTGKAPSSIRPAIKYLVLGVLYITVHQTIAPIWSTDYMVTDGYALLPLWKKSMIMAIWCRSQLYKYIGCWLVSEGSCTLTGLSHNGRDENGNDLWDGCANVKLVRFETCHSFQHIIDSFNLNTNKWVACYVYKRLKFLGNKLYSQIITLLFLALWHGYYPGYYLCFFMEFVSMNWEKQSTALLKKSPPLVSLYSHGVVRRVVVVSRWVFIQVMMGVCLTPFIQLTLPRIWQVWKSMYFCGLILFCSWPLVAPVLRLILLPKKPEARAQEEKKVE